MSVTDDVRAPGSPGGGASVPAERFGDSGFDRTPPQDIAAEQCVLGGMLLSKDAIADVVEILRAGDFYRPAHAVIFDAVLDLYGRGEPADPITIAAALTDSGGLARVGGAPYLHTLISSVPTAASSAYYARIVAERAVLRRLVEAGTRIVQMGYGSAAGQGRDADEIVDLAQQAVYDVTERRVSEDFAVLADLLQPTLDEIESVGSRDGMMAGVPTGFGDLDRLLNGLHPGQLIIVAGRPGLGKALALDTPLATPDGWTTMGDVALGDRLMGANGKPTTVTATSEVMLGRTCYEAEFSDGSTIVADAEHLWATWDVNARKAYDYANPGTFAYPDDWPSWSPKRSAARPYALGERGQMRAWRRDGLTARQIAERLGRSADAIQQQWNRPEPPNKANAARTTAEIAATLRVRGQHNHAIPVAKPLHLPDAELPIDPYVLGYLLGDGDNAGNGRVACDSQDRKWLIEQFRTAGYDVRPHADSEHFGVRGIRKIWRSLGLSAGKHVPSAYLRAAIPQRLALIQGLIDSGGHVDSHGAYRFTSTNGALVDGFNELVVSLGCTAQVSARPRRTREGSLSAQSWEIIVPTGLPFARLPHKILAARQSWKREHVSRYIVDVRPVPSVPVRCVTVETDDHLYLAGRSMIPTHNSTAAMDFARSASVRHNLASAIFSLEMSKIEIVTRLLAAEARVPMHVLRSGQLSDDDWTRLARRMGEISEAPIFIDDTPNMTLMEIRAKARRLRQRNDLKLVIVDYLQLMTSPKRVESRQQEVAELSRGLKLLAKEIGCPVIAVSQLNRGPEQRTDKRPQLSDLRESGCLTADTTLLRADTGAPVTFDRLLRDGYEGVQVWSMDEDRRMVAAPITNVFPAGEKQTYRLTLASGRQVKASGNHKFLTFAGWKALDDLAVGSRIAIPHRTPEPIGAGIDWSTHRIGLLAHLIGEGCVLRTQPVHYTSQDEANLTFVEEAARAEFGITPRRVAQSNGFHVYLPAPHRCTHGRGNPLHDWFRELDIYHRRSYEKRIPDAIYGATNAQVAVFLRHLWATDGNVTLAKGKSAAKVYYASSSRALADGVMALLSRFGIIARLKTVTKAGYRPGYHVVVADGTSLRTFCREIGVHGARGAIAVRLLASIEDRKSNTNVDALPLEAWDVVKAERVLDSDILRATTTDDVLWDRVVSVEPLGLESVYDATVKGTHSFVADGIVAHNSIEQDADVVILLHRDDYYDKESPRAGEADFIVAKHRNGPTDTVTVAAQLHFSRFVDMAII